MTPPRPSGPPPYFSPGQQILWHYRRPRWAPGEPQFVYPVTVVRDDADGLVAWLPAGTPYLAARLEGGGDLRSGDVRTAFTAPRIQGRAVWQGCDTLRVAPTGVPWSVWLFFADGRFDGWYVNLEQVHTRDATGVYSGDHVLDVVVEPDGTCYRKDEDELALAVEQGRYTAAEARQIEADAAAVEAVVASWGHPFRDGWEKFEPDPSWPLPPPPYPHL